ncbi:hypothetical protein NDU88_006366 [Pleurodeles waltl]|uniref:Uncharacterized protein n=1 Tax=Pleurodeles waltl TaxID=8319 RepID=A0AAV7PI83_PLEWA|nr:hypothetical protein NDU88_006366 [Pleurodeles waltl]
MFCPWEPQAVILFPPSRSVGHPFLRVPGRAAVLQLSPRLHEQASARSPVWYPPLVLWIRPNQYLRGSEQGGILGAPRSRRGVRATLRGGTPHLRVFSPSVSSGVGCMLASPPSTSLSGLVSPGSGSARLPQSTSSPPLLVSRADSRTSDRVSGSLTASSGHRYLAHSLHLVFQAVRPHTAGRDPRSAAHKGCLSYRSISGENRGP